MKKMLLNVAWKYLKVQHLSMKNVTFTFHAMAGSRDILIVQQKK